MNCLLIVMALTGQVDGDSFGIFAAGRNPRVVAESGAKSIRNIVQWYHLQPTSGPINFTRLDQIVKRFGKAGIETVVTLRCNSTWATVNACDVKRRAFENHSSPPKNMQVWKDYVKAVVERYDGDGRNDVPGLSIPVKHWQCENEVIVQWEGTQQQLFDLVRAFDEAVEEADIEAKVISPAISGLPTMAVLDGTNPRGRIWRGKSPKRRRLVERVPKGGTFPEQYHFAINLIKSLSGCVDIVDTHIYASDDVEVKSAVQWIRSRTERPIWSTEFAVPLHDFTDEKLHDGLLSAQRIAFNMGVERIFWSSMRPLGLAGGSYQRFSLLDKQGNKKPAYYRYQEVVRILTDESDR